MILTLCYSILLGFRSPTVGIDTSTYLKFYHGISLSDYIETEGNFEIGYSVLSRTFSKMHIPFSIFLFFISIVTYFLISIFCFKTTKHSLVLFTVINCLGIGNLVFSATRQMLALSIMLVGFVPPKRIEKRLLFRIIYSSIFTILGSFFHYSALIGFVILIIHNIFIGKRMFYFVLLMSVVFCAFSPWLYVFIYRNARNLSYAYFPDFSSTPFSVILYTIIFFYLLFFSRLCDFEFAKKVFAFFDEKLSNIRIFKNFITDDPDNLYKDKNVESVLLFFILIICVLSIGLTGLIFSRFIYFIIPFVSIAFIKVAESFEHKSLTFISISILLFGSIFYFFVTGIFLDTLNITPYSFGFTV